MVGLLCGVCALFVVVVVVCAVVSVCVCLIRSVRVWLVGPLCFVWV